MQDRFAALEQAHENRSYDRDPDDRPDLLIAEAEVYYGFIKVALQDESLPALVEAMPPGACDNWGG